MRYKNPNKKVLIIIPAVLLLAGGYAYYRSHKKGAPESNTVTASQETKGEAKASPNDSQSSGSPQSQPNDKSASNTGARNLLVPSGTFVSNHTPSLSSDSAEQSICVTTPGATCEITFTKGNEVKSLQPGVADAGGAVYWSWKLQDLGLGEGEWQIKAVAKLGDNTQSAEDSIKLAVRP